MAEGVGLAVFFLVGLLGGAHCLGMCGPFVTLYADRMGGRKNAVAWRELRQHALFNAGRTASYALVGGLLGLVGGLFFEAAGVLAVGSLVRAVAGVAAGLVIGAVGAGYLLGGTGTALRLEGVGPLGRVHDLLTVRVDDWVDGPRIALLGAFHGLLPCPILYPAFVYALARGSPVAGAASLGVLGLGTFPTLFLYGTVIESAPASLRARLHRALGAAFLVLAYLPLSMGLAAVGVDLPRLPVPFYQPLA